MSSAPAIAGAQSLRRDDATASEIPAGIRRQPTPDRATRRPTDSLNMSATPPSALQGSHSPAPIELLWDRYKSIIYVVVGAILLALLANFGWGYMKQKEIDEKWSAFAESIRLEDTYTSKDFRPDPLAKLVADVNLDELQKAADAAEDAQKPYLLLALARGAMAKGEWDRAEAALSQIESGFPGHSLTVKSDNPVQHRDLVEKDEEEVSRMDQPEFEPAEAGSVVDLMRAQIASAKGFSLPDSFKMPAIPDDAPKVRFTIDDGETFTIALMPQAEKHKAKFLELAGMEDGGFWKGIAIDSIQRSTERMPEQAASLGFGYASTKEDDRTKWSKTEPSEHQVEYEVTGLSHFPGAVAGQAGEEGKSCVDRIQISIDDQAMQDGQSVVFGYVVEGLEALRTIVENADLSAQDEDRGRGQPTGNIRITNVEIL